MTHDPKQSEPTAALNATPDSENFQLNRTWLLVGIVAVILGVACGLVMSSATFFK